mmetsp:Transcript_4274/g.10403  ORF Transcript_4274/g.10403 Transcript_4274/m.10403 type:complete len:263 (+) Transcript_4274:754-1542(+)
MGSPATVIELEMGDNDAVALFGPGTCRSAATVAARPRRRKAGCHVTVQHGADAVARRRTPRRRPGLQPHACHRRGGQRRRALRHEPDGPRHVPRARVYILMTLAARSERPRRRRATFGRPRGLARAAAKLRQPSRRAQDEPVFHLAADRRGARRQVHAQGGGGAVDQQRCVRQPGGAQDGHPVCAPRRAVRREPVAPDAARPRHDRVRVGPHKPLAGQRRAAHGAHQPRPERRRHTYGTGAQFSPRSAATMTRWHRVYPRRR